MESLITVDDSAGMSTAREPVLLFPVGPREQKPTPTRNSLRPRRDADDRLHYKWFTTYCDPVDYHFGSADGTPRQITNSRIERHLNAPADWRSADRLTKLPAWRLAEYRRGINSRPLYCRPKRNRQNQFVAVRLDFDQHQGQTDAVAAREAVNNHLFGGTLYCEPSKRGESAWIVIHFTPVGEKNGETLFPGKHGINRLLNQWQTALQKWVADRGFTSTIELNGRFTTPGTLDDGTKVIADGHRGSPFKMPRCPNTGDAARLHDSRITEWALTQALAADPAPIQPTPDPKPITTTKKPPRRLYRQLAILVKLVTTGDKNKDRCRCVRQAMKQVIGHPKSWPDFLTDDQFDAVIELANDIYEKAGLNRGARDRQRNEAFRRIAKWMLSAEPAFDPASPGSDQLWFGADDIAQATEYWQSTVSREELDAINANKKLRGQARITHEGIALAHLMMIKDAVMSNGHVPALAIRNFLQYMGINAKGTYTSIVCELIRERGQMEYTHNGSFKKGRWCRSYRPTGNSLNLPFVSHMKPEDIEREVGTAQAREYVQIARGYELSNNTFKNLISIKPILTYHDDQSFHDDPAYWASLAEIASEYEEIRLSA